MEVIEISGYQQCKISSFVQDLVIFLVVTPGEKSLYAFTLIYYKVNQRQSLTRAPEAA